jgi:conjugal transfer pilus assembly protein TraV
MNILNSSRRMLGLASLLALATGCTTIGGSMRGDFACRAPKGNCAPMSAIDARAIAHMADTDDRPADLGVVPVAPVGAMSSVNASVALRTGERTLTILLPAHVDGDGVLHDAATVHAVVEAPRWTVAARTNLPDLARSFAPSSLRAGLAEAIAPATEGPGSSPARVPHPLNGVDAASPLPPGFMPSPSALAAARKGHRITRPGLLPPLLPKERADEGRILLGTNAPKLADEKALAAARVTADVVLGVRLERPVADYNARRISVLPLAYGGGLRWIDPAGYAVAQSDLPEGWDDQSSRFRFELAIDTRTVTGEAYQPHRLVL